MTDEILLLNTIKLDARYQRIFTVINDVSTDTILDVTYYRVLASGLTEITLPPAVINKGKEYNIIRVGTDNVTITPNGSETISGDTNLVLTSQWDSVVIVSDGSNWIRCS